MGKRSFEIHYKCDDGSQEHWGEVEAEDEAAALVAARAGEPMGSDYRPLTFVARELKWCAKCGNSLSVVHLPGDPSELCTDCAESAAPGQVKPLASRRDLRTVELPEDAKMREVFLVMLADDGSPVIVRSTDIDSNVMRSAAVPTPTLLADLISGADRNLGMLVDDHGHKRQALTGEVYTELRADDVRKMMHAWCRNLAQGLAGRVLP